MEIIKVQKNKMYWANNKRKGVVVRENNSLNYLINYQNLNFY